MPDQDVPKIVPFTGNVSSFEARLQYVCPDLNFHIIHLMLYYNVLGITEEQYQDLGAGSHAKLRARISRLGLLYLTIAEETLCVQLEFITGPHPAWKGTGNREMIEELTRSTSKVVGQQAHKMASTIKMDLVTGLSTKPPDPPLFEDDDIPF